MEFLPILLIVALGALMFFQTRKQRQQVQAAQQMQAALEPGDVVVTAAGMRGTVVDTDYEETVDLEIAPGVITTWVRRAIVEKKNEDTATDETPEAIDDAPAADETAKAEDSDKKDTDDQVPAAATTGTPEAAETANDAKSR